MPGEVTNDELARRLDDRFGILRDDIHEINQKLEKFVPRELHDAQRQAASDQMASLRTRIDALESRSRWLVASVIIPTVLVLLNWWLTAKGVKP